MRHIIDDKKGKSTICLKKISKVVHIFSNATRDSRVQYDQEEEA